MSNPRDPDDDADETFAVWAFDAQSLADRAADILARTPAVTSDPAEQALMVQNLAVTSIAQSLAVIASLFRKP